MKTIYIFLSVILSMYAQAGTLNEALNITTYWHYGGGATHLNLDAVREFMKQRAFVDNTVVALDSMERFKTEPTPHGNYKYDTDLANRKALGHYNYWSTQGLMDWQEAGTYIDSKTGKVKNRSMRKTCIPLNADPNNPETWKDLAELCKRVAAHYNGKGILDAIGFQNEYDFKWNVWRTMRQKEYAVLFKECYKAVRSVNKEIDIYTGGSIYPNPDSVLVFLNSLKAEFAETGEEMPTDFFIDVHIYMRNSSNDQTGGTYGITPEAAKVYELGMRFDKLVKEWNLKGFVFGEGGWSPYSGKQSAPVLQGYDSFNSQGLCSVRSCLILGTIETFKGFYFWHCNEKYDAEPYNFGFNYRNWTATQARIVTQEYRNKYGNYLLSNFRQKDQLYAVDLIASTDTVTLVWTDQNKYGEYDAKPREGKLEIPNNSPTITLTSPNGETYFAPANVVLSVNVTDDVSVNRVEFRQSGNLIFTDTQPPYTTTVSNLPAGNYTFSITAYDNQGLFSTINNVGVNVNPTPVSTGLTVVNNRLHLNGQPYKINEANSPESRLRDLNYAELDLLANCGVNTIYCTLFGGDVTSVHPFINRANPSQGFDDNKVNQWVAYFEYWLNKSPNNILHLLLSEKENHYELSEANHKAMISYFANKFRAFEGRIIYDREELDQNKQSYINTYYSYLKQVAPLSIRAMHNNTNENPWNGFENSDLIQFLSLQEWQGNFNNRINSLTNSGNWAAYASEVTGGIATHPSCSTLVSTLATAGGANSSGAGYFISSKDHSFPNFQSHYCECYKYGASLMGGTVTPPDTTPQTQYALNYALNNSRQPNNTLHGAQLSAGKIWAYINVNTDIPNRPLKFYYDNIFVNNESGRPYELAGGNGYNVTDGTHTVRVDNSQGVVIAQSTFTVGIVIPPDTTTEDTVIVIPPDTTEASIKVEYSQKWTKEEAFSDELENGQTLPQGSYWLFVRTGTGTHTFSLQKGTSAPIVTTDSTPIFDIKQQGNTYLQKGFTYKLIVTNSSGSKTITFNVN